MEGAFARPGGCAGGWVRRTRVLGSMGTHPPPVPGRFWSMAASAGAGFLFGGMVVSRGWAPRGGTFRPYCPGQRPVYGAAAAVGRSAFVSGGHGGEREALLQKSHSRSGPQLWGP
jgi:hypothetical protein